MHFYLRILVWFLSFARSADYGDDMDEFNGTGRGRGRYYQVAWALKKMNMLSCAVSVLYCVLSRFHVIFCVFAFLSPDFSMIFTSARSAYYGDDMDEFNGTGRGRGGIIRWHGL